MIECNAYEKKSSHVISVKCSYSDLKLMERTTRQLGEIEKFKQKNHTSVISMLFWIAEKKNSEEYKIRIDRVSFKNRMYEKENQSNNYTINGPR